MTKNALNVAYVNAAITEACLLVSAFSDAEEGKPVEVDGNPLAYSVLRAVEALEELESELERLEDEARSWRERYEAEANDHKATLEAYETERNKAPF